MNRTSIEWTHRPETGCAAGGYTWNPIRARRTDVALDEHGKDANGTRMTGTFCTRISPGCTHCYASSINKRFGNGLEFTVPNLEKIEFFIDEKILAEPLRRKKPATIFVGDMFDLFHEAIPRAFIRRVVEIACEADWHTYQFLTKRVTIMREVLLAFWGTQGFKRHMWFGASVEDQPRADQRVPELLQTPAAVRFLSVEPMLEAVCLTRLPFGKMFGKNYLFNALQGLPPTGDKVDWVICGGESGTGARTFDLAWAESLLSQCQSAGVAFFMKQIGSFPVRETPERITWDMGRGKGGDPSEWPEHLRVRQFPSEKLVTA